MSDLPERGPSDKAVEAVGVEDDAMMCVSLFKDEAS
jgi:hypothetical protein